MKISIIVAADEKNGIGKDNNLLCYLPADLKYFKNTTLGHHIIMGRKTFESIGKPLPNRTNIIVSGNSSLIIENCMVTQSLEKAIEIARINGEPELFIAGGGTIYNQAILLAHKIYLSRIHHQFNADTFFPTLTQNWQLTESSTVKADEKNKYDITFQVFENADKTSQS